MTYTTNENYKRERFELRQKINATYELKKAKERSQTKIVLIIFIALLIGVISGVGRYPENPNIKKEYLKDGISRSQIITLDGKKINCITMSKGAITCDWNGK